MTDQVLADILLEVRELAHTMVRFDMRAKAAAERNRWHEVAEYTTQRELARERRSALQREVWLARQELGQRV